MYKYTFEVITDTELQQDDRIMYQGVTSALQFSKNCGFKTICMRYTPIQQTAQNI